MITRGASFRLELMCQLVLAGVAVLAGCGRAGLQPGADAAAPDSPERAPYRALAVSTGRDQTCVVLDDHRAKCWGNNEFGQLGLGDLRARGKSASEMGDALPTIDLGAGRTAAAISGGRYHTCAILDDGSVRCWGLRGFCGLAPDSANPNVGDDPGEMGDALPDIDLGPGRTAKLLASGYGQSCAILDDGTARCWGLGTPTGDATTPYSVPLVSSAPVVALAPGHYGVLALFQDGTAQDLLSGNDTRPIVPAGAFAIAIAGSDQSRCAVLKDGSLYCVDAPLLASTFASRLASGKRLVAAGIGEIQGACGLFDDGSVWCRAPGQDCTPGWCDYEATDGLLGVRFGQPAVAVTTSGQYTFCALLASGAVRCWGQGYGPPNPAIGFSFDPTFVDGGVVTFGAFHDVDLGSHEAVRDGD